MSRRTKEASASAEIPEGGGADAPRQRSDASYPWKLQGTFHLGLAALCSPRRVEESVGARARNRRRQPEIGAGSQE
eukprot:scaffold7198_cov122-Isochrysis_galbana.AAC.4